MSQVKESEWAEQWDLLNEHMENEGFLFQEWIKPNTLSDFNGKEVLDGGCGAGEHMNLVLPYVKKIVGVDFNPSQKLRSRFKNVSKAKVLEADLAHMNLNKKFDMVYSIGVLHHTENPSTSFNNLVRHVKKGGRLIIWVYSYEGNFLNRTLLEFFKKYGLLKLSKSTLYKVAWLVTALLYLPIYTIYKLPLTFLPFYEYFDNWRKLTFKRNLLNVFDKMNAPTTHFIDGRTVRGWFDARRFKSVHISPYKGVSWRASGTKIESR